MSPESLQRELRLRAKYGGRRYANSHDELPARQSGSSELPAQFEETIRKVIREENYLLEQRLERIELACGIRNAANAARNCGDQFMTLNEFAAFCGMKRASVSKLVCKIKKSTGRDPIWIRRLPGRERSFTVDRRLYEREIEERRRLGGGRSKSL